MPNFGVKEMEKISLPCLETLKLTVLPSYGDSLLCNLVAPSLEWLKISYYGSGSYGTFQTSVLSTHASQLRFLSIFVQNLDGSGSFPPFPQLQTLTVCVTKSPPLPIFFLPFSSMTLGICNIFPKQPSGI